MRFAIALIKMQNKTKPTQISKTKKPTPLSPKINNKKSICINSVQSGDNLYISKKIKVRGNPLIK